MPEKNIIDQELSQIIFIANDAKDNIARIKSASWKVLATVSLSFGLFNSDLIFTCQIIDKYQTLYNSVFYISLAFFLYVVVYEYTKKIIIYRKRIYRAYKHFSQEAKDVHGETKNISDFDSGDVIYLVFCILFITFFGISHYLINL